MIYMILIISLNGRVINQIEVPTLQACVEMTRETNDDGSVKAACLIKTKRGKQ